MSFECCVRVAWKQTSCRLCQQHWFCAVARVDSGRRMPNEMTGGNLGGDGRLRVSSTAGLDPTDGAHTSKGPKRPRRNWLLQQRLHCKKGRPAPCQEEQGERPLRMVARESIAKGNSYYLHLDLQASYHKDAQVPIWRRFFRMSQISRSWPPCP